LTDLDPSEGCLYLLVCQANPERLTSVAVVEEYLKEVTVRAEMTRIPHDGNPLVVVYESPKPEELGPGVTGVIVWAESHCACHTWPEWKGGRVEIVVHSCKPVKLAPILEWTKRHFDCRGITVTDLSSGLRVRV
jgi:S-adenosylmethionine/arginine decarboxylase-like enzyme